MMKPFVVAALLLLPSFALNKPKPVQSGCSGFTQVTTLTRNGLTAHYPAQPGDPLLTFDTGEYATLACTVTSTTFTGWLDITFGVASETDSNIGGYQRTVEYIKAGRVKTIARTFQIPCNWYLTQCVNGVEWYVVLSSQGNYGDCTVGSIPFLINCSSGCVAQP